MNALEAIEFMKNGGVVDCCVLGTEFLYKIENNVLKYSNKNTDGEFKEAKYFPLLMFILLESGEIVQIVKYLKTATTSQLSKRRRKSTSSKHYSESCNDLAMNMVV